MSEHAEPVLSSACSPASDVPPIHENKFFDRIPWVGTWVLILCVAAVVNALYVAGTHGTRGLFVPIVAVCVCLVAGLFDAWTQRIPNPLSYTAILLGLGLNGVSTLLLWLRVDAGVTWMGAAGVVPALEALGLCTVLGIVAGLFGCSYGDLKLFVAVGALAGFPEVGNIAVLALGMALVYGLINLAMIGRLTMVLRIAAHRMMELFYLRRFETPIPEGSKMTQIPMAIPMAVAVVVMTWVRATHVAGGGR